MGRYAHTLHTQLLKQTHHRLLAWQISRQLVQHVYELTRTMPKAEQYGLISQLRRGATSIPANIAEGAARGTQKEFRRFLLLSRGSLAEVETHLILASDLGYIEVPAEISNMIQRLFGLIGGLISKAGTNGPDG